jgi:hypothetical protein
VKLQECGRCPRDPFDVARTAIDVHHGPDFAFENILDPCHRKLVIHHIADFSAIDEIEITRIRLDLDLKFRSGSGNVDAVFEAADAEFLL